MQCLSGENKYILKYNLFKVINEQKRGIQDLQKSPQIQTNFQKNDIFKLKEFIDKGTQSKLSKNECYCENVLSNKILIQKDNYQNENKRIEQDIVLNSVSTQKKKIYINKQAIKNAYSTSKQLNMMEQQSKKNQLSSLSSINSTIKNSDLQLSYSRTLSRLKDIQIQDLGKQMIKNLIEKSNKKHKPHIISDRSLNRFDDTYNMFHNHKRNGKATEFSLKIEKFNCSAIGNEQNEQQIKAQESLPECINHGFDFNRDSIQDDMVIFDKKQEISIIDEEKNLVNTKYQRINLQQGSTTSINNNINHNNNDFKIMGNQFNMRNSFYDNQRIDDSNSLSTQFALLSSRRKGVTMNPQLMRNKQKSLRNLSPDDLSLPLNKNSEKQYNINQTQLVQKIQRQKIQNMQFYALPTNTKQSDQYYSSQFQNVRIPTGSPQMKRTRSICQKGSKANFQNHIPGKISAKFRQSLKESIERHQSREQSQLQEIQKLYSDSFSLFSSPNHIQKDSLSLFSKNEPMQKKYFNEPLSLQNKQFLTLQTNSTNYQQNTDEMDSYIQNNFTKYLENQNKQDNDSNSQQLDANTVFEYIPVHSQIHQLNQIYKMSLTARQNDNPRFVFSEQNFRKRNLPYKKIFKI